MATRLPKLKKKSVKVKSLYKNKYFKEVQILKDTIPNWDYIYDTSTDEEERINQLVRVEVIGQALSEKYAWAIPDARSMKILRNFSPLIEIGCGKKYWGTLLENKYNGTVVGFDKVVDSDAWSTVLKGGPSALKLEEYKNHTLFLCYPDEDSSLAEKCLRHYQGEYVIHVGELLYTGGTLSYPQAPWGRTSSADFQSTLAIEFHCVLTASIPRFPFSLDCISVWKRTQWVEGKDHVLGNDEHGDDLWASIPVEERLPVDRAAPLLAHLLE